MTGSLSPNPPNEDYADKAGVDRFDETHSLTAKETKKVSDHYPVWATFYTGKDTD